MAVQISDERQLKALARDCPKLVWADLVSDAFF